MSVDEYIVSMLDEPYMKCMEVLDNLDTHFANIISNRPKELKDFKSYLKKLDSLLKELERQSMSLSLETISNLILYHCLDAKENYLKGLESKLDALDKRVAEELNKMIQENREYNKQLRNEVEVANIPLHDLIDKKRMLETYRDEITDMCAKHGVLTSDIMIDTSLFSIEELSSIYDEFINYLQENSSSGNIITAFRNKVTDRTMQGVCLLGFLFLAITPLFNLVALAFYIALSYNQVRECKKAEYYTWLLGLLNTANLDTYGYMEINESNLRPENISIEEVEEIEVFKQLEDEYKKIMYERENNPITKNQVEMQNEWNMKLQDNQDKLKEYNRLYRNKLESLKSDVRVEIEVTNKEYKKMQDEYKFLGSNFSYRYVYNDSYILGRNDEHQEERVFTGAKNLIFRKNDNVEQMNKFLQVMIANAFSNVYPGKLTVHVYDPNGFGRSVLPLYRSELQRIFITESEDLSKILTELKTYFLDVGKRTSGLHIADYNKKCEELNMTPIEYKLLLVLSQPKTIEEDEQLREMFENSPEGGVYIWVVSNEMRSSNAVVFKFPFEGVDNSMEDIVTHNWCAETASNFVQAIANAKPAGLPWKDFIKVCCPPNKIWSGNADNEMILYPGFKDGDPSKCIGYGVGNTGNVHVLGVGGTGAGKSVFLNHLIATISAVYAPTECELWLCDFKGTEFKFYLPYTEKIKQDDETEVDGLTFMLPHIKACLCTSDGDYATSLFKALRDEADLRYDILKDPHEYYSSYTRDPNKYPNRIPYYTGEHIPNFKGTVSWNKHWRQRAEETGDKNYLKNLWPKILFICDEFQVIFEKAAPENLDKIKADITQIAKVGRAANVHIFFTSQSMNKTLSADILQQFTLRFALRCDKAVSQEILGTSNASDIKEQYGFLFVKATGIADNEQPRFATPYLSDKVLRDHIKAMYLRAIDNNIPMKDVITYEEVTKHFLPELEEYYKINGSKINADQGVFFIGPRMVYSANKAPDNFILTCENNTNVASVFSEYSDIVMFFNILITNINNNKVKGTIIINSQLDDIAKIVQAENAVTYPERHSKYIYPKDNNCRSIVSFIKNIYESRKEKKNRDTPVYIILMGWNKGKGFAIEREPSLVSELNTLLQIVGEFNIHVIFIFTSTTGVQLSTIDACLYRIAGLCSQDDSTTMISSKVASKVYTMPKGWVFIRKGAQITRDKLYISESPIELQAKEIVIG